MLLSLILLLMDNFCDGFLMTIALVLLSIDDDLDSVIFVDNDDDGDVDE